MLWLDVCPSNKDSFIIAGFYVEAVEKFGKIALIKIITTDWYNDVIIVGCPTLVRADRGTENSKIAFMQPLLRRHHWKKRRISTTGNKCLNTVFRLAFQEHSCIKDIP